MDDALKRILEGLEKAIQAEIDGYHFYMMVAKGTSDEKGRQVFEQLAQEEVDHTNFLRAHHASLSESGKIDPNAKLIRRADLSGDHPIFSDELRSRAKDAHFERSALSIGAQLELNAIQFYRGEAEAAQDPQVQRFYEELVAWETGHYDALNTELTFLKGQTWEDTGFSPF